MVKKMVWRTFLPVLLLALSPNLAAAESANLSKKFSICVDQSDGVTAGLLDCIAQETGQQDARLNAAYKKVMSQLPENRKTALRDAQRAWIKFRDSYSNYLYDPDGGSMARVISADWYMRATAAQADVLEREIPD